MRTDRSGGHLSDVGRDVWYYWKLLHIQDYAGWIEWFEVWCRRSMTIGSGLRILCIIDPRLPVKPIHDNLFYYIF